VAIVATFIALGGDIKNLVGSAGSAVAPVSTSTL
jgi:hypothetical protein